MTTLRAYQRRAIDDLYAWFERNEGNPCLVLPTGAGKSHIVAALCKDALQQWPETRILMLTHVKELIEQNAEKMLQHWPTAPLGIYSASIGKRQIDSITFAGIQSVRTKADLLGHIDLVLVDECFVAGTKISTPSGNIDIDKVRCGDVVFNQCGMGIVEAVSCKSTAELYEVEFDNGQIVRCTGNHPFFTDCGWKAARNLESGSRLFGIKDMCSLWESVSSLDQEIGVQRQNYFSDARASVEQANILLSQVCKEITPYSARCSSTQENQQQIERNKASTYSTWRERAIAAFTSVGITSRAGGGVDCGTSNQDLCGPFERNLSIRLQSRHCESEKNDCNRVGRGESYQPKSKESRQEKRSISCGPRVVRVSHIKSKSDALVFNLQVSGHPSYFADGVAVHNCHLINHQEQGGYRTLLARLKEINPALRVVGLTATPYRLGHGLITDKPALFDALLEPVTIEQLIAQGYLSTLRSKVTQAKLSVEGVHKRGGEYIESELQAAVDTEPLNQSVVDEVISRADGRKAWLFFCAGVAHAERVCEALQGRGIKAACVTGETPKRIREQMLTDFKSGALQALTNANVLTTGFDHSAIDLIAMLRPTMSPGLYVQMAGRGLRPSPGKTDCLVLDFAGVVGTHGPITNITPPTKQGDGNGEAPVKVCDNCNELCPISARVCPACGHQFHEPEEKKLKLCQDDIMCM